MTQQPAPSPDVVVVCTANVARSPLLAARLHMEAEQRLGVGTVVVASAGTEARSGDLAADGSRRVAQQWGVDLDRHVATPMMYIPWEGVQLVLTMTRRHAGGLVIRYPDVLPRTFTVNEFVERIRKAGSHEGDLPAAPPRGAGRDTVRDHIADVTRIAHERRPRLRRRRLDIADPIGARQEVYDALGDRFVAVADDIAGVLFGPPAD